jgi:hypothetical protein
LAFLMNIDAILMDFAKAHPRIAGALAVLFLVALLLGSFAGYIDPVAVEARSVRLGALVRLVARLGVVVRGSWPLFAQLVTGQIPSPPVPYLDRPDGGPPTPRQPPATTTPRSPS